MPSPTQPSPIEKPLPVILRSLRLLISGQAAFQPVSVGRVITRADGRRFEVFRHVVMKLPAGRPSRPGAIFCVWFCARGAPWITIGLSWLTIPLFFGMRGFRSKQWLVDRETGEFGGIYEWDTREQAQAYSRSYAMRLSALRSVPGKFSKEIIPALEG